MEDSHWMSNVLKVTEYDVSQDPDPKHLTVELTVLLLVTMFKPRTLRKYEATRKEV